ncbi:hypothetical protein [Pedobacter sp. KACC 23697]|uniref:DAC domain-containing protein n=1 Tax=Pedobacter sp. KACC 23697 TaxID=3149230 RepID=A0AAU7K1V4_9SPHI
MYQHIQEIISLKSLKVNIIDLFVESLTSFLGCRIKIYHDPYNSFLEKYGIDILANPERGVYEIDSSSAIIIGRITNENGQLRSAIGFLLIGVDFRSSSRILGIIERTFSFSLTSEIENNFRRSLITFGDDLIKRIICTFIAKGKYNPGNVRHILEYFFKLRTTSFEGSYFSTGAIISKSGDFFNGTFDRKRFGMSKRLTNFISILGTNSINKRLWYLVDGKTSFLLGSKNLLFRDLFILNDDYAKNNFLAVYSLALTLKGGDFLIKIENEKSMSIITADGIEFLFYENRWKLRNFKGLKKLLQEKISTDVLIIDSILFYILNCSKKQMSSILWFPDDLGDIDQYINPDTKNSFLNDKINITERSAINHLFRCLSSDGVSVFDKRGNLEYMGVIVDIGKGKVKGIAGTGETAASILCSNGVSIKISQDGAIKIFTDLYEEPYHF